MTNDLNALIYALVTIAEEEGNTKSLEEIRNNSFKMLASGERKTLINTSLNGKSYSYQVSLPADQLFIATSSAIKQYNNGRITAIRPDFTFM